jgi:hypothetical protein
MDIFVSKETQKINIYCKTILDKNGKFVKLKVNDDWDTVIECDVLGRDFEKMSKVIEDSSIINSVTGKPMLRTSILCRSILLFFYKRILVKKRDGSSESEISLSSENINRMDYDIVKELANKWLASTSGKLNG